MTPRRRAAPTLTSLCCAAVALVRAAAAQIPPTPPPAPPPGLVAAAQPQQYLLVTDVADGRALFVNPAGLARSTEASLGGFITATDSSSGTRVSQYGALIASRGAAFGWQHDDFAGGASGNVFALGLGLGGDDFSIGGDHKWYSGTGKSGGSWDAAARYRWSALDLAAVWGNIGSPQVRDSILEETLTAGVAIDVWRRARVSGEWHTATSGFPTRYVRAAVVLAAGRGVLFSVTGTMSGTPALRRMAFAVQLGAPRVRAALFGSEPSTAGAANQYGASIASVAPPPPGWGPRRR